MRVRVVTQQIAPVTRLALHTVHGGAIVACVAMRVDETCLVGARMIVEDIVAVAHLALDPVHLRAFVAAVAVRGGESR